MNPPGRQQHGSITARTRVWRRFLRHRLAVASTVFLSLIGLASLLAPYLSPHDPFPMDLTKVRRPPSWEHPLGTDRLGRDTLTRLLYGGRVSAAVAISAVTFSTTVGTILGALAGYYRGAVDAVIMRITDIFIAFPTILLLMIVVPILGPRPSSVVLVLGMFTWMGSARIVRGQFLAVMTEPYVEAAIAAGASPWRTILRHLLPNAAAPVVVAFTLGIGGAMLAEAALSFLGLGIQPPVPSWGNMLQSAQQLQVLVSEPWVWMAPGAAIALTVLSVNFIGDGLRDALDPRQIIGKKE